MVTGDPKPLDPQVAGRLACDTSKPSRLGAGSTGTITRVFCDTSFLFGDVWLALAVAKAADASYQDFCREVQELTKDADVAAWKQAWSVPGALDAGLDYYRANHLNPPYNETHPKDKIPTSWSAKDVTEGAKSTTIHVPTLVIWGLLDTALQQGNLSGMEKLVPDVHFKLYPHDTHWVSISKSAEVTQDIRDFVEGKDTPKETSEKPH